MNKLDEQVYDLNKKNKCNSNKNENCTYCFGRCLYPCYFIKWFWET